MSAHDPPSGLPPGKPPASPDDVRDMLAGLRQDALPDEREFAAGLHRRLVASGAPPASTWLGRLADVARELWQDLRGDRPQKRALFTGAVLGALVTAVALSWLAGPRGAHEALRSPVPHQQTVGIAEPAAPMARPAGPEHKSHTLGDRRLTRDRMGTDIGAERPERPRR
jgi:hypothetical protein